jgi:hypothetical protein
MGVYVNRNINGVKWRQDKPRKGGWKLCKSEIETFQRILVGNQSHPEKAVINILNKYSGVSQDCTNGLPFLNPLVLIFRFELEANYFTFEDVLTVLQG